jgi:hypothetical protein
MTMSCFAPLSKTKAAKETKQKRRPCPSDPDERSCREKKPLCRIRVDPEPSSG